MHSLALVDIVIIISYIVIIVGIGFFGLRGRKNLEDYYIGGRASGSFTIGCLWMSSWIGGATVVGSVDNAYRVGISIVWYCMSMAIGCVIFAFTSAGLIQRLGSRFSCLTYPELIEKCYGPSARIIATITTFLAYVAYGAGQFLAMALIIQAVFQIEYVTAVWISGASIIIYTAIGGFLAVSLTSVIQAMMILVSFVFILAPYLWTQTGGLETLVQKLPAAYFDLGAWGWFKILGVAVTIILTFYTSMDSYTRCFAAKNAGCSRKGALIAAAMVGSIALATTFIGMAAKSLLPALKPGENIMSAILFYLIPNGLKGIVLVGLLAAIMSTGSVCLLVASANITRDIYQRFISPKASSRTLVMLGSFASILVGVLSCFLASTQTSIIEVLYIAFTINSAGLFIPTIAALLGKHGNERTAVISMGLTLCTVIGWYIARSVAPAVALFQYDPIWPGLLVSIITFAGGAVLFPVPSGFETKSTT